MGILDLTHPFPMSMNALLAGLFMYMASPNVAFWGLLILVLSVAGIHGSFGSLNDYCDYPLDKVTKPAKPLVRALTTRRFALSQALILAVAGLSLSLALNWLTACFAAIVLGTGVWYDLWAKGTLLSWIPYAVFIPSLPLWGFAAAGRFESVLLLAYPLGVLLSLGLNVANTLPDRDDDVAHGLRGLVHRLELTHAVLLAWSSFAGAMLLYPYPRGMIESPADVIDANYPPRRDRLDVCQIDLPARRRALRRPRQARSTIKAGSTTP